MEHSEIVERIKSLPELIDEAKAKGIAKALGKSIVFDSSDSNLALLDRLKLSAEPLIIWALHRELDRRQVPPSIRQSRRSDCPQTAFLTWSADLLWFCKRNRGHKTAYSRWKGIMTNLPGSESWHKTALWIYRSGARRAIGFYYARGLAIPDVKRQELMTMPTNRMRADRTLLKRLPEFAENLLDDALKNRDRSGAMSPGQVAARRGEILRLFLLAGRSATLTATHYAALMQCSITRQSITRQIEAIERATKLRLLNS